jgi:pyruvate carboxylase
VGDLALYLVTRSLTTADLLDPTKAASIDFPESVVGLLRGDLGFPHRGFPAAVEEAILKGAKRRMERAGLVLPPADFAAHIAGLSAKWGRPITPEESMSSLMYPQVFADFMARREKKGSLLRYLPTPVYLYGMVPGDTFVMHVPLALAQHSARCHLDGGAPSSDAPVAVTVEMKRVGPLKAGSLRTVVLAVNGHEQHVEVKDSSGKFVFEGPMADTSKPGHVASPMPGQVEKLLVAEGDKVAAGDTLCTISAMKMEVKCTAPFDGKVAGLSVAVGTRVVEGALLLTLA